MIEQFFDKEFVFDLPKIEDKRGNLSFVEVETHIPFTIQRACWIYDIEQGQKGEGYALKTQQQVIIALSGSVDVAIHDVDNQRKYTLSSPCKALYVPNMTWLSLTNFSTNSVCLILNSETYNHEEYISDFELFKKQSSANQYRKQEYTMLADHNNTPQYNTVFDCSLFELPTIKGTVGNIVSIEIEKNIPFHVERTFHIYNIPSGAERGMHAHKYCHELLVATLGSFEVDLDDGVNKKTICLNNPNLALHIPPGVWASQKKYSSDATCLAFASKKYNLDGYINSYEEFKEYRNNEN